MKTEDFIRTIFAERSNQDPFSPNDSGALLDQLNSIRSIESDIELVSGLDGLVFQNQLAAPRFDAATAAHVAPRLVS